MIPRSVAAVPKYTYGGDTGVSRYTKRNLKEEYMENNSSLGHSHSLFAVHIIVTVQTL